MTNYILDKTLASFSSSLQEPIHFFRKMACLIETDPNLHDQYSNHHVIQFVTHDRHSSCSERVKTVEALSYGDPSVLLGAPGPSLSGIMVRDLGNATQQSQFFDFVEDHSAKSFFAMTEPHRGSDVTHMHSTLTPVENQKDAFILNGEKWLVGNGAVAKIGVVFAKINDGPLGLTAILITPDLIESQPDRLQRMVLRSCFLKGAQLSYMKFENFVVPRENILGYHLKPLERGLMGMLKTFNRMRPCVAAFSIGHAQAIFDFLIIQSKNKKNAGLHYFQHKLSSLRVLLHHIAQKIDCDPLKYGALSSAIKLNATHFIEEIANYALVHLGHEMLIMNPWFEKAIRDANGFEFMEGTSNIQKLNAVNAFL